MSVCSASSCLSLTPGVKLPRVGLTPTWVCLHGPPRAGDTGNVTPANGTRTHPLITGAWRVDAGLKPPGWAQPCPAFPGLPGGRTGEPAAGLSRQTSLPVALCLQLLPLHSHDRPDPRRQCAPTSDHVAGVRRFQHEAIATTPFENKLACTYLRESPPACSRGSTQP